jgi:hypothetical protein
VRESKGKEKGKKKKKFSFSLFPTRSHRAQSFRLRTQPLSPNTARPLATVGERTAENQRKLTVELFREIKNQHMSESSEEPVAAPVIVEAEEKSKKASAKKKKSADKPPKSAKPKAAAAAADDDDDDNDDADGGVKLKEVKKPAASAGNSVAEPSKTSAASAASGAAPASKSAAAAASAVDGARTKPFARVDLFFFFFFVFFGFSLVCVCGMCECRGSESLGRLCDMWPHCRCVGIARHTALLQFFHLADVDLGLLPSAQRTSRDAPDGSARSCASRRRPARRRSRRTG